MDTSIAIRPRKYRSQPDVTYVMRYFAPRSGRGAVRSRHPPSSHHAGRLRALPMMLLGALVVHRLEYITTELMGWNHGVASDEVHGYLGWLAPLTGFALMLGAVGFVASASRAPSMVAAQPRIASWRRMCALIMVCLVTIYVGQEMAEGIILAGDPLALLHLGSLVVLPVAFAIAGLLALGLAGAAAVRRMLLGLHKRRVRLGGASRRVAPLHELKAGEIALSLAGRAPPALSLP